MDELLAERVKQLREIDDDLLRIVKYFAGTPRKGDKLLWTLGELRTLRNRLADMIREAERQHAEF